MLFDAQLLFVVYHSVSQKSMGFITYDEVGSTRKCVSLGSQGGVSAVVLVGENNCIFLNINELRFGIVLGDARMHLCNKTKDCSNCFWLLFIFPIRVVVIVFNGNLEFYLVFFWEFSKVTS